MVVNVKYSKPFYSEAELSEETGIPRKTLARFRKEGSGPPFVRFGRRTIRYPKDKLREWIAENAE